MSNPNYTAVMLIIDESGSMADRVPGSAIRYHEEYPKEEGYDPSEGMRCEVMEDALHLMLEQQARKLAGYITVDAGYFDNRHRMGEVDADPMLINLAMGARGGTEAYRGGFHLLEQFTQRIEGLPEDEKPGHVVVVIITDGDSSDGQNYQPKMYRTVRQRLQEGWDFAFLSAAPGAAAKVGYGMGIPQDCWIEERATDEGINRMAERLGGFITVARGGGEARF